MLTFKYKIERLTQQLLESKPIDVGSWHSAPTNHNPMLITMETCWVDFMVRIPNSVEDLQLYAEPNLPWAEEHFQERISGKPLNPPPSHERWPWNHAQHQNSDTKFSHTYPERFWPKWAGYSKGLQNKADPLKGIRYGYGDLGDLVNQLKKERLTRQAVLPVFFPEDTGNVMNERVPCSLTYHFMVRDNLLHCHYTIRSCDFVRHFRDDVYMAGRLMQWLGGQIDIKPGNLKMSIGSLHAMEGDRAKMEGRV